MARSRLAPKQQQGYATPQDMARAIDAAIELGKFYTQAAQDALVGLTILRDQLAAQPAQSTTEESRMLASTTIMIKRLEGLLETRDLTDLEKSFVRSLVEALQAGKVTRLSGSQVDKLDQLHDKHFA